MTSSKIAAYKSTKLFFRELAKTIRVVIKKDDLDNLKSKDRYLINRSIKFLLDSQLVNVRESFDSIIVTISERGKNKAIKYNLDNLKIMPSKSWDKKWRLVIFDVPEEKKLARNAFQNKLKDLGFLQLQKSVYIYPFDCEKEIEWLRSYYEIREYVSYFVVLRVDREQDLIKQFLQKGIAL